jgi:hypothetical protein
MWDQTSKSDLIEGVARSQRLAALMNSDAGDDIRGVLLGVCQSWFAKMIRGEPGAHMGMQALNDFVANCDLVITLAEGMKMELTKRVEVSPDGYARAAAD